MFFYLGTMNSQLDALGQAAGAPYTRILGIVLPLGFFAQFGVGALVDGYGLWATMTALWAAGVLVSALNLVPVLQLQVGV